MRSTATKHSEERYSAESSAISTVTIVREKRLMDEDLGGSVNGLTIGKVCPAAGTGPELE
jgi:hypothetical protein